MKYDEEVWLIREELLSGKSEQPKRRQKANPEIKTRKEKLILLFMSSLLSTIIHIFTQ
ncbi:MAG TPA: hypothetical protein PK854_00570 [Oscillospiraceae bacterium]|nr:hypothetical protein [Oscillospiraceae bacterium]HPS33746.1 hypothetical protein [Oscillospiraceae bacterium]